MTECCLDDSQHLHLTFPKCCLTIKHSFPGAKSTGKPQTCPFFEDQQRLVFAYKRAIKRYYKFRTRLSGTLTLKNERARDDSDVNGETFLLL